MISVGVERFLSYSSAFRFPTGTAIGAEFVEAHFVVVKGNPRGRIIKFTQGEFLIGRGAECHIRPDSEWVSRQHCLLALSADAVHLKDLGSTNGTLINGQRLVGSRELVHGDTVQVGPLVLQLRLPRDVAETEAMKQTDILSNQSTIQSNDRVARPSAVSGGLSPEIPINADSTTAEHRSFDDADLDADALPPNKSE